MKFNNETLRAAVKEWLDDESKAEKKYGHISDWDTSEVTDMHVMFYGASSFNQPLEKWDVSKVTDMSGMFYEAKTFNQPLEKWDVSQVTTQRHMFRGATSFNQPLEKWDVSRVTEMQYLFNDAESFNQPLEKWDVSRVTTQCQMFRGATSFNQPLEKWDVSKVTDMSGMFYEAESFNQPLEKWDVSKVTDMSWMFYEAESFNQPLEKWDVSQVTDMSGMFQGAESFNQPLEKWDVSKVTKMNSMFYKAESFNQPLEKWDVSKVKDMGGMFRYAKSFNQPLEKWDVSQVTNMIGMFYSATSFTHQVPKRKLNTPKNSGEESLTQQGPISKKLEHYISITFSESVKELLEVYHSNRDVEWYFAYKHDLSNSCFQCEKLDDTSSTVKISSFLEYQERTGIPDQDERFFDETNVAYIANSITLWLNRIKRTDFLDSFFERLEDFYQSEDDDFLSALLEENGYEIYNALGEYEMIEFFDCTQDDFEVIYADVDADEEGNIIKTKFESSLFEEELDDESFAIGFKYLD